MDRDPPPVCVALSDHRNRPRDRDEAPGRGPTPFRNLTPLPVRVTFICNRNLYRSPIAAAILRSQLEARGVDADVDSVGVDAIDADVDRGVVASLRERGVDLSGHRSRPLDAVAVHGADLVVTMEHHQSAEVLLLDPDAWPRTFTLREAARRAAIVEPRSPDESLRDWVGRLHRGRKRLEMVGAWSDDIADPAGGTAAELLETIDVLDELVTQLVEVAWPAGSSD